MSSHFSEDAAVPSADDEDPLGGLVEGAQGQVGDHLLVGELVAVCALDNAWSDFVFFFSIFFSGFFSEVEKKKLRKVSLSPPFVSSWRTAFFSLSVYLPPCFDFRFSPSRTSTVPKAPLLKTQTSYC